MDPPEDPSGSVNDPAARQHQELSTDFSYFSDSPPIDYVESWSQASGPGLKIAAPTAGHFKPLQGLISEGQATENHHFGRQNAVQRIDVSPDVCEDWLQRILFNDQEVHPHHHATYRHLDVGAEMPCQSYIPRSHISYAGHNNAGYSSAEPPSSITNLCHSILSTGGPQEFCSWQQIDDASQMPFQYPSDQETLTQMPEDLSFSFEFNSPIREFSNLAGDGQHGDGAIDTLISWSSKKASESQDDERGRKKAADAVGKEGCQRCYCRTSKCLKLYCECFAAELECINSCACKGCHNSVYFRDSVNEARRQIESRNPFAFILKKLENVTNSYPNKAGSIGSGATLSSMRNKPKCNCKKFRCLKGYCRCFKANAGCSNECNCESCCNPFGPKSVEKRVERREMSPLKRLDGMLGVPDSIGNGNRGQSASTCEETVCVLNSTPSPSHLAYFNDPHTRGCLSSTQVERHQGTLPLQLPCSHVNMPPSDGDKALHDLVGVSTTHDMAKGVNVSNMGTSSLPKLANTSSPNQGQPSTPQFQPPGQSPGISPRSRHAFKPDADSSFPRWQF